MKIQLHSFRLCYWICWAKYLLFSEWLKQQVSFDISFSWKKIILKYVPIVTIIYIIGGSPRLVSSPESIRRVGRFRFVIKTVTIYLRRGKKRFPGMNKSSCHPTDINGRKYILIIIFQSCYNTCFCTSFVENITSLVSQIESPTLLIDSGLETRRGEPPMM